MKEALKRLTPATDKGRLKGSSVFAKSDCEDVCRAINEFFSVPKNGWVCELNWRA